MTAYCQCKRCRHSDISECEEMGCKCCKSKVYIHDLEKMEYLE